MELRRGQVAVITGAGSGIGLALAERFATAGLNIVLADVQDDALQAAAAQVGERGVETLAVRTDVSREADVQALAAATLERFGAVHVVCNNAGVAGPAQADPWFGPLSAWEWVMGVNFWGVVHGCRTFLPHLAGGGHIVNTASIAGLYPGFAPPYDASKHAVVAITESLYHAMQIAALPIGVSVLCPGWVRTNILDSERNWQGEPLELEPNPLAEIMRGHVARALAEGMPPAQVADAVHDAVASGSYWVVPAQEWLDVCTDRWATIAERANPVPPEETPGMPLRSQIMAEVLAALGAEQPAAG